MHGFDHKLLFLPQQVNYFKPSALVDILRGRDPATLPCLWTADGEQVRVTRGTNADGEP